MTTPAYTAEQAEAIARDYRLMIEATKEVPHMIDLARYVHNERIRRLDDWALAEGLISEPNEPCCPWECETSGCEGEHTCFDEGSYRITVTDRDEITFTSSGGILGLNVGILALLPLDVVWSNDPAKTEAWIQRLVQENIDHFRARKQAEEMQERAHLAELLHKYENQEHPS